MSSSGTNSKQKDEPARMLVVALAPPVYGGVPVFWGLIQKCMLGETDRLMFLPCAFQKIREMFSCFKGNLSLLVIFQCFPEN